MANLPESATYDAGVYQLELTDPVQGGPTGVSNAPLKNLANRTAWLKSQIDGIKDGAVGLALYARLASPTFTGSPSAPTAALGDNTTKLATTAFVQETLGGFLSKSIAGTGSVTLTAVEAGNGIIRFTGALTGNRDVIVPSSPTRSWVVFNDTTGAFTLTVKTASGTGVLVPQGKREIVYCDGTNVAPAFSDFVSVALEGNPTAPTPAKFDNDTSVATTAFVRTAGMQSFAVEAVEATTTLTANHVGKTLLCQGAGNFTITLPLASTVPAGTRLEIFCATSGVTVSRQGGEAIHVTYATSGAVASLPLGVGDSVTFIAASGAGGWLAVGQPQLFASSKFASSFSSNGYQRLPSGLIVQWGQLLSTGTNGTAFSFPIAFPNACLQVALAPFGTVANSFHMANLNSVPNTTGATMSFFHGVSGAAPAVSPNGSVGVRYIAIGY